jgi:AraC-like DNA-binding protein
MPFQTMAEHRAIRTRDVDQATAFMADNVRSGVVKALKPDTEIGFGGHYFAKHDFMAGEMRATPGWSFEPLVELDAVMAWLALDGRCLIEHGANAGAPAPGHVLLTTARSTRRIVFDAPYNGFVLGACSDTVRQEMQAFLGYAVDKPRDFMKPLEPGSPISAAIVAYGVAMHAGLAGNSALLDSPIGLRRIRDGFINLTLMSMDIDALAEIAGPARTIPHGHLQRAEEFMRAHADLPIGISDVAAHLGISVRALQYTYKRLRGTTPLAALLQCRLDGVRAELASGPILSIAGVAAKWGFTHLGRFSRQYQIAFGEKASETSARARARG